MNFEIVHFLKNDKINEKYICKNHGGSSITPTIKWNDVKGVESYAIILEDPDVPCGKTYIHMYIPYINKNINKISSINTEIINYNSKKYENTIKNIIERKLDISKLSMFFGKNSRDEYGYYGPCNPEKNRDHHYTFKIYALDGVLPYKIWNSPIYNYEEFEKILKNEGIKILDQGEQIYKYRL